MTTPRRLRRPLIPVMLAAALLPAACASTAAPASNPSEPSPSVDAPASAIDLPTTDPDAGSGASSGSGGDGTVGSPVQVDPVPVDPGAGQAKLLRPKPGQKDLRPAAPIKLEASVDGRHVLVKVTWYGGVEPCNVLDSVKVERSGGDVAITPMEGTGDGDAMCIEIAELHATIVDLGDLEPGTYRILAPTGDAAPVEITIA